MKKIKLIIMAVAALGLASSSAVYAGGYAPGEGLYVGAFVGHSAGHVSAKVVATEIDGQATAATDSTVEIKDGGLALNGVDGGGWLGYGYKMGDLHVGLELDAAGGGGKFKVTSSKALEVGTGNATTTTLTEVSADMKWNTGAVGHIGYYLNQDTLFSLRGGITAAKFEVKWNGITEEFYGGGPRYGASIQSRLSGIDPNLSIRLVADYVDFMTAPVSGIGTIDNDSDGSTNSEVSGAMYNTRIGLVYSFFDVGSLF